MRPVCCLLIFICMATRASLDAPVLSINLTRYGIVGHSTLLPCQPTQVNNTTITSPSDSGTEDEPSITLGLWYLPQNHNTTYNNATLDHFLIPSVYQASSPRSRDAAHSNNRFHAGSHAQLLVEALKLEDSGVYRCDAYRASQLLYRFRVRLVVRGRPLPPLQVSLTPLSEEALAVHWVPGDDRNSRLLLHELWLRHVSSMPSRHEERVNVSHTLQSRHEFHSLRAYEQYSVQVRSFNAVGGSEYSPTVETRTLPGVPVGTENVTPQLVRVITASNHVNVTVICHCLNEDKSLRGPFRGYFLDVVRKNRVLFNLTVSTDSLTEQTIFVAPLEPYQSYEVHVQVYNGRHYGPRAIVPVRTMEGLPDTPHFYETSDRREDSFKVWWTPVDEKKGAILYYHAELYSHHIASNGLASPTDHQTPVGIRLSEERIRPEVDQPPYWLVKNLTAHTWYRLRVAACTRGGCGNYSRLYDALTDFGPPEAPHLISVWMNGSHGVIVNWTQLDREDIHRRTRHKRPAVVTREDGSTSNTLPAHPNQPLQYQICWQLRVVDEASFQSRTYLEDVSVKDCLLTQTDSLEEEAFCHCSPHEKFQWARISWALLAASTRRENDAITSADSPWFFEFSTRSTRRRHACDSGKEPLLPSKHTRTSAGDWRNLLPEDCYQRSRSSNRQVLLLNEEAMSYIHQHNGFSIPTIPISHPSSVLLDRSTAATILIGVFLLTVLSFLLLAIIWRGTYAIRKCRRASEEGEERLPSGNSVLYLPTAANSRQVVNDTSLQRPNSLVWKDSFDHPAFVAPHPKQSNAKRRVLTPKDETFPLKVSIHDLARHVASLHADSGAGFRAEFQVITQQTGENWSTSVANQPENRHKNRYANILPYDHSRVCLRNGLSSTFLCGKSSDYINASYVDGYHRPLAYIATQSPLQNTCADFWQMVWEQRSNTVVMLAAFVETAGPRRCAPYWLGELGQASVYGEFQVTLTEEIALSHYTLRTFKLKCLKSLSPKKIHERTVHHSQYTDWLDCRTPHSPLPLLAFIRHSLHHWNEEWGPVIVHCSGGEGGTGTFICIDALIRQMELEHAVNVPAFLKHIRNQRMKLVQTDHQYAFIYDALREYLVCPEHEVAVEYFHLYAESLQTVQNCGCSGMEKQFQLCVESTSTKWCYTEASRASNDHKIPVDQSHVTSDDPNVEVNSHMKPHRLAGFFSDHEYLLCQHPVDHTEEHFWRMVWHNKSPTVVVLSCSTQFWPQDVGQQYGCLRITVQGLHSSDKVACEYELLLTSVEEERPFVTRLYCPTQLWRKSVETSSSDDLLDPVGFLELVRAFLPVSSFISKSQQSPGPVQTIGHLADLVKCPNQSGSAFSMVVVDEDGRSRAGPFYVLTVLLQQMLCLATVDVYRVVKMAHLHKPGLFQSQKDLAFVYQMLELYLNKFWSGDRAQCRSRPLSEDGMSPLAGAPSDPPRESLTTVECPVKIPRQNYLSYISVPVPVPSQSRPIGSISSPYPNYVSLPRYSTHQNGTSCLRRTCPNDSQFWMLRMNSNSNNPMTDRPRSTVTHSTIHGMKCGNANFSAPSTEVPHYLTWRRPPPIPSSKPYVPPRMVTFADTETWKATVDNHRNLQPSCSEEEDGLVTRANAANKEPRNDLQRLVN